MHPRDALVVGDIAETARERVTIVEMFTQPPLSDEMKTYMDNYLEHCFDSKARHQAYWEVFG